MKRTKKTVEKRTYTLQNAFPRFVSIVARGANFTPFSELRFSDSAKFADVEINKIVFSKDVFDTQDKVETYLQANDYDEYTIEQDDSSFFVPGEEIDKFEDIQNIEYENGVQYSVGKLKTPEAVEPVGDVLEAEVVSHGDMGANDAPEKPPEDAKKLKKKKMEDSVDTENVTASDPEVTLEVVETKEEVKEVTDIDAKFAELEAKIAALSAPATVETNTDAPLVYSQEQVDELLATQKAELVAEFDLKIAEFSQSIEKVVDENPIIIQNNQGNQETKELVVEAEPVKDEARLKFEQKQRKNLVGLI